MCEVTLTPITGLGGFEVWCKGLPSYDTHMPGNLADYITQQKWEQVVRRLNQELASRVQDIDSTVVCGIFWLCTPAALLGIILLVKTCEKKKNCSRILSQQISNESGGGITWSFHIDDKRSWLKVRVAQGTPKLSDQAGLKQDNQASNHNMMATAPMSTPYAIPVQQVPMQPVPLQQSMPAPRSSAGGQTPVDKVKLSADQAALADQFTPPAHMSNMKPFIVQLKEFEEKMDSHTVTSYEEKEIREIFEKVREILAAEAEKALKNPAYIKATFMKYHGRHLDAYNVAHRKGSGSDTAHHDTVKLATELGIKAKREYPKAQQRTLDPIVLVQQAEELKEHYVTLLRGLAEKTGAELELPPNRQLKGLYRIVEKSAMRPGEMQNMCNNVFDVLRSMLIFKDDQSIGNAMKIIADEVEIVRVKERLFDTSRTSEGWGDIMINFRLKLPSLASVSVGTGDHICEIQLARSEMYLMRKTLGGHEEYFWFRAAFELHEVNSIVLPTSRLSSAVSSKLSEFKTQHRFSQCGLLQELLARVNAAEVALDATELQIGKSVDAGDYAACAQLEERRTFFKTQTQQLEAELHRICAV
eukprot:GEMP01027251.1.p1 GENE.GEMP01027251.1~~GEMP01027251.1.p1  ORF type:complete len:586 (+),score=121.68 GEMP01027251.1:51-1808(+)